MPTSNTYELKDGRTLTITVSDAPIVVPPDPVPSIGIVSFDNAVLAADKLSATAGDYVVFAKGQYTGGLQLVGSAKRPAPGTYKDRIFIQRKDGAAFNLNSVTLNGSSIPVEVYGRDGKLVIPSGTSISVSLPVATSDGGKTWYFTTGSGAPTIAGLITKDGAAPDAIAGYVQVAKEGETVDYGSTVVDVAYGANGFYSFLRGVSGKVNFANGTFPDPVYGVGKKGYASKPVPVPDLPPVVTPAYRMNGGISDGSTAAVHAPFFKSVGFNSIRIWASFNPTTGELNGGDGKIDSINQYFALGIIPRIVLTPDTNADTVLAMPQKAIDRLIARLDKRVQINLINEPNLDEYWPNGNWLSAFTWAHAVAGKLKAGGFKVGSPSFTGWIENWEAWWDQIIAKGLHTNYDVLCFHLYPNAAAGSNPSGWMSLFDTMGALARKITNKVSHDVGRIVKLDVDEWGFGKNVPDSIVRSTLMKKAMAVLNRDTDMSAYFIVGRSGSASNPKDPHDLYNWLVDFKLTPYQRREDVIAAFIENPSV